MPIHHFSDSQNFEKENFSFADEFYTEKLGAKDLYRIGYGNSLEKRLQRNDVDLIFSWNGRDWFVSEKFRKNDFGDLLIEFYSNFPQKTGWMDNSKADLLAYFAGENVYIIDKIHLKKFYHSVLFPAVPNEYFEEMISQRQNFAKKEILLKEKPEKICIISAENNSYHTVSIGIPFRILVDFGIKFKKFRIK